MDHGEGQLAAFFHIIFRDAQMRRLAGAVGRGAAAQNIQFRAFFHHHDVVHALARAAALDEQAGLHRFPDFDALAGPDEVPALKMFMGRAGEFVLFRGKELPEILGQAVVFFQGLFDAHQLQAFPVGAAVHARVVEMHECAADVGVAHVDARMHQTFFVFR